MCCCRFFWFRKSILLNYYLVHILYIMCHQKMPIFISEVSVIQLELAVVSVQAVGICSERENKFQKLFKDIFVSSCLISTDGYYLPAQTRWRMTP